MVKGRCSITVYIEIYKTIQSYLTSKKARQGRERECVRCCVLGETVHRTRSVPRCHEQACGRDHWSSPIPLLMFITLVSHCDHVFQLMAGSLDSETLCLACGIEYS